MPAQPSPSAAPGPFTKVAECLYRHHASGVYYALVKRGGKQHRRSLKTTDRQLATRRLSEFRSKVNRLDPAGGGGRITFHELADRWLGRVRDDLKPSSALRRMVSIKQLRPYFGDIAVRNITAEDCDRWVERRGAEISASTFNNERDTLRLILDAAHRDGLILDNPARSIGRRKIGKARIVIPTRPQFNILIGAIRSLDRRARPAADLVELLAYSGMRLREATELCWGDIDFGRGLFVVTGGVRGTKNQEVRSVPIFPGLARLLGRLANSQEREPTERIIAIGDAKRAIETACRRAELPHFSHHTFRHYFVSNAIEAGIDFKVIAAWLGHKDGGILVAKTYGHLRDSHSFEMAKRVTFSAQET